MGPVGPFRDDREVRGGQDREHARDRERVGDVDPSDPGVGGDGQNGSAMEQTGRRDVGGEAGPPGDFRASVDAR